MHASEKRWRPGLSTERRESFDHGRCTWCGRPWAIQMVFFFVVVVGDDHDLIFLVDLVRKES